MVDEWEDGVMVDTLAASVNDFDPFTNKGLCRIIGGVVRDLTVGVFVGLVDYYCVENGVNDKCVCQMV